MSLPDHIGWDLVRAARLWEHRFATEMVAAGHPWFAEARGRLIEFIGRDGIAQNELHKRAGATKQAVAQHVDRLVSDGVIARLPDPEDHRRRRLVFTQKGRAALRDADRIKGEIERAFARSMGPESLSVLRLGLKTLIDAESRQAS
ncbi:MAG: MarR family transcriptional regulator [Pseudomonadota bacterium]